MISKKKFGTTVTAFGVAAGMLLGTAAPAFAEENVKTVQETQKEQDEKLSVQNEAENAEEAAPAAETPEDVTAPSSDENTTSPEEPETPDPAEVPTPTETPEDPAPSKTPDPTPSDTPEPTPSETPEPTVTPEPSETPTPTPTETPKPSDTPAPTPTETPKSDETQADDWIQTIDYGKYIGSMKKDLRADFAQIDKAYAYAKVDTKLNVRESGSTSARIVGTLPAKALCFVIADADQEWVYIESGDVRGFVRTDYLQQGKEALEYVTSTGEDQMKLADQVIDPSENASFSYKKETVYEVKTSTGNGIITFAKQFVGRPYVWGGNSLTDGIDCSHFVWQILTRCGAYDGEYRTSDGWRSLGTEVTSLDEARAGDVICYNGHVALYDGEGKIVEALNENVGITCNRPVDCDTILTIRRFAADDELGETNAEKIWNYFLMHGFTKEGAAGIMGNIANEASTDLNPTLLEYGSTSRTSLSGEQYTNLVDAGIISRDEVIRSSRFGLYSGGRYSYGLCGFTDPTIKEYLCRYTIDLGKSLGSLSGQLDSLLAYLSDYNPNLLDRLKNAEDVDTAATAFMREYEKCANQGTQQKLRTTAAEQIYSVMESYDSPVDVE